MNLAHCLYEVEIRHHRQTPVAHSIHARNYLWFVDVDELPHIPLLARFDAADHLGDPNRSIRANVEAVLTDHGIELDGGRITMLAQARSLGYVFNPLSVFWCHARTGELRCVVAEVHNTYGQQHAYVVRPDATATMNAETNKEFYVSPFYPVDGYYRMSLPEPDDRLAVTITLHRPDGRPFVATVRGVRRPANVRTLARLALRYPLSTMRVRAGIARHGIALYLKGLPVMPRPDAERPTGKAVATTLAKLEHELAGVQLPVRLRAWDGSEAGPAGGPVLVLRSRRALRRILARPGELGLARAYVSGDLDVEGDLTTAFRQVWASPGATRPSLTRRQQVKALVAATRLGVIGLPPKPPTVEARVAGRLHSRARDRAVIAHHYDLSNDFYQLILDESMAYSSAKFETPDQSLADAQRAKLDLICRKLELRPGMRLLDVGCGWGSLILHAAEHYGVHATGITLSGQQRDFVEKLVADRGLEGRVEVSLRDYRELTDDAAFDAVSSIEMGEHVGLDNYPTYVAALHRALKPGGRLLLQQMSRRAGTAPGGGPFIEAYIAPDMHMRPLSDTIGFMERAGFEICGVEGLRADYVRTARAWLQTLETNYDALIGLVGEPVARVWRLYLAGGALSFEQGRMGVEQILASKT